MNNGPPHTSLTWRTAFSCNGGACVQVAASGRSVLIGSSRKPGSPVLAYTREKWREFVTGVKKGDFDHLPS